MLRLFLPLLACVLLAGCANRKTTDIPIEDASQVHRMKFGTVLAQRPVSVRSDASAVVATGAVLGAGAGAVIAHTNGAALAGLVAGGITGALGHRFIETDNAVEYTIALEDGSTVIISQLQGSGEHVFNAGEAVAVQVGAKVNRVLPAAHFPTEIPSPKRVTVTDATGEKTGVRSCDKGQVGAWTREGCTQH